MSIEQVEDERGKALAQRINAAEYRGGGVLVIEPRHPADKYEVIVSLNGFTRTADVLLEWHAGEVTTERLIEEGIPWDDVVDIIAAIDEGLSSTEY